MGIVPQGRWVKVGSTTTKTVKTVKKTVTKTRTAGKIEEEGGQDKTVKGQKAGEGKEVERKENMTKAVISPKGLKDKVPESRRKEIDKKKE